MNKYFIWIIGATFSLLFAIGSWWVKRVESSMEITSQLQFRSLYLNGNISAAPVATPAILAKK